MKSQTWNVMADDFTYRVEISAKGVTVSPGEEFKIRKLKRRGNMFDQIYEVPVAGHTAELHMDFMGKKTLVYEGIDCATGAAYIPFKMPAWGWVFVVLHAINFFLLIGGAIGGVIDVLLLGWTAKIAGNSQAKILTRVLKCIAIYVIATIIQLLLVILIIGAAQ